MLPIEALQSRIANSELGQQWIMHPLINKDVWALIDLGYTKEELAILGRQYIYFNGLRLSWLKLLTKLTVLASVREKHSFGTIKQRIQTLKQLDKFLASKGYIKPEILTDTLLLEFVAGIKDCQRATLAYASRLWTEEQWLKLPYTHQKYQRSTPQVEIIPEEVLYQIYENLELFPAPLERLFRLQLVLGCRIGEMLRMPRRCLKQEDSQWFLLRWIEKQKHWKYHQIYHGVAELIQEQQRFIDLQFGNNSNFDKLFCKVSTNSQNQTKNLGRRFNRKQIYTPDLLSESIVQNWLKDFREESDLRDKYGKRFNLTSHMFRRTKASIMAYCETEDEYIAAVLGHSSLDMLPHYRQRSLERLEKEAKSKGYVDMYGRVTSFKPRKRRYEKLAQLLKVNTTLGECHRPVMLGDCQYRYACLSCHHHRVTKEDKPKLLADYQLLQQDLEKSRKAGQERRVIEINRLLGLLKARLEGLEELENLNRDKVNEQKA
ncbi:tyrosine-type recombinase/integrase [Pleurocapsales cyanobacterium LEGE 10410]|nr:tyrosine-type recombinase/integrase [Pleurocapsales cyanobacterium LEGE 10410]